jgi:hypothetical protein
VVLVLAVLVAVVAVAAAFILAGLQATFCASGAGRNLPLQHCTVRFDTVSLVTLLVCSVSTL